MNMLRLLLLACAVGVVLAPQPVLPQQPAPDVISVPLERPEPMTRIKTADPAEVMRTIVDMLGRLSYQIDRSDVSTVDAKKLDVANRPAADTEYNRVIIWLERDFDRPLEYVKVYFLWGRYESIMGRQRGIRRVVPSSERDIPMLKEAITTLARP